MRVAVVASLLVMLACGAALAGQPVLVQKDARIAAVVDEDDFDGLTATAASGETYAIWTPPSVSYEALAAFHRQFKKKTVTFRGDVYRDERGLYLAVEELPGG